MRNFNINIGTIKNIKECPFCKELPEFVQKPLWNGSHGYHGKYSYSIKCTNPDCKMKPSTREYDDIWSDKKIAIKKACDDWNYRKGEDGNEKK